MKITPTVIFLLSTLVGCNTQMAPSDNSAGSDVRQPFVPPPPFVPIVPPTTDILGRMSPLTPGIYTGLNMCVSKVTSNSVEEITNGVAMRDIDIGPNGLPLLEGVEVHVGQTITSPLTPEVGGGEITSILITDSAISVRSNISASGERGAFGGFGSEIYEFIDESTIRLTARLFLTINFSGNIGTISQDCEMLLERL